ncbi:MAG TPA: hypothetical protein VG273_24355 [Bryobacteraceae bacterium]|nr:hypothetical protein [Bryobacteraceae bacterium]
MSPLLSAREQRQFRVLYRDFLSRIVDLDILSSQGDLKDLMTRVISILAAFSLIFCYFGALKNINGYEFVISATLAAAGLFAVFAWNAVFPDKRDCLVLGPLPIRRRTLILARLAAVATALAGVVLSINSFAALFFAFSFDTLGGVLWGFITWWVATGAAGAFVFCFILSVQGLASQLLSWRRFLRVSGGLQLLALFAVLGLFFVTPPFLLTIEHPTGLIQFLPSYWFTGLLLELKGNRDPRYAMLAAIALRNLAIAVCAAGILYVAAWIRNVRRIAEAPDIAPSIRRFAFAKWLLPTRPIDRAILLFTWRTIARSRQHRLLLAAYGGFGFAAALAFSASFFIGGTHESVDQPNIPFMTAGLLLLAISITGTRAVFVLPQTLQANWVFRITAIQHPAQYSRATRKALLALAAMPVLLAAALCYFSVWPGRYALEHMLILVLAGTLIADLSLHQFRKIPFACSWLPGGSQFKLKLGIWMLIFVIFAGALTGIEFWAMHTFARFCVFAAMLFLVARWAARRNTQFAASAANLLQFDELPPSDIFALDLRSDGEWSSDEAYASDL